MVITVPAQNQPAHRLRPINLNKDVPQVIKLLELVFGKTLGEEGRWLLTGNANIDWQPSFLWRLSPGVNKLAMGYVWEENGRIIGNATVLNTKLKERYLVVNVAVHPDHRRRGIARELMATIVEMVRDRGGKEILLQVEKDNIPAVNLYQGLNFVSIGSIKTWRSSVPRLREISPVSVGHQIPFIRELRPQEWQAAFELDQSALDPNLNWPEPLSPDMYRRGFRQWVDRYFNGRHSEVWVIAGDDGQLQGLVSIWNEWSRPYIVNIRVRPHWRSQLERPLLAKAIRRLTYLSRRNVKIDHRDDDETINQLLTEANFVAGRTLTHMYLVL